MRCERYSRLNRLALLVAAESLLIEIRQESFVGSGGLVDLGSIELRVRLQLDDGRFEFSLEVKRNRAPIIFSLTSKPFERVIRHALQRGKCAVVAFLDITPS